MSDEQGGLRLILTLMIGICLGGMAGCASQVPRPIPRESVILVPAAIVSTEPQVMIFMDPRDMIPFVGLPLNSIGRERTENALAKKLDGIAQQLSELLTSTLIERLNANGYTAELAPADRVGHYFFRTFDGIEDLPSAPPNATVVDVMISVWGALAPSIGADYQPVVDVVYRVVDVKSRRVLWRKALAYNSPLWKGRPDNISGDPSVHWKTKDDLMVDTERMTNALKVGVTKLGAAVATEVVHAKNEN